MIWWDLTVAAEDRLFDASKDQRHLRHQQSDTDKRVQQAQQHKAPGAAAAKVTSSRQLNLVQAQFFGIGCVHLQVDGHAHDLVAPQAEHSKAE